jgi:hypothetical protein
MSIDATILEVQREGADLRLILGPRIDRDDKLTCAGQSQMRILDATWSPEPGMDIWGDAGSVEITPGALGKNFNTPRWYVREGFTRLREPADLLSRLS